MYPQRQPFIVGEAADKILGFLAGLFGSIMGVVAAIVVMFLWVGSDPAPDTELRRRHATSVSIWSGVGCAIPFVLLIVLLILGIVVFVVASPGSADFPDSTPIPYLP